MRETQVKREVVKPKLTKPPRLVRFVEAEYPKEVQDADIEGRVAMKITLDKTGRVDAVEVVSSPDPRLSETVVRAVRTFEFSPAEVDGKPSRIQVRYAYNFVLESQFSPRAPEWMLEGDEGRGDAGAPVIVGQVREQGTRLPIPGAAVAIPEADVEVRTDARGRFGIPDIEAGTYRVQALSNSHKMSTIEITVREGEQTKVKFYLASQNSGLYETVVRGKRRQTTVSRVTLRGKQLTTVPGTFGDPVRVVQNLPGVARVPFVGGALLIRGAAPGDSGTFLDGVQIPILFHFLGGPSVLNGQFLDRIDYYPGNADVRYNRLIAGVVDVQTRDTFTEQWKGSVDLNLLNVGVFLDVPVTENISVAAAVRRSYIDAILPAVLNVIDRGSTTVVPVYYDYQVRTDIKLAGNDRVWFLVFGSDDQLSLATNEEDDDVNVALDAQVTFHRIMAKWRSGFSGGKGVSRLAPYAGFDLVNFDTGGANVEIRTWLFGLREDLEFKFGKRFTLRAGVDLQIQYSQFDAMIPVPRPYRDPATPTGGPPGTRNESTDEVEAVDQGQALGSIGLYVDGLINVTDKFQIIPGLRFDTFFYIEDNVRPTLDPRITMRYALSPETVLKAGAGIYSKSPQPNQANRLTGNPNLVVEHAAQFSVGFEQQVFWPALKLDVQGYFNWRYDNVVLTDEVLITEAAVRPRRFSNEGEGFSTGIEVLLKHDVTRHFYGWVAYTLSWAQQRPRAGDDMARFVFDQRHILTAVGSFRFGSGWEAGFRFRLVSGRPDTPVIGGIFDADGSFYRRINGAIRSVDQPLFHQLDLRAEKTWFFDQWRLSVYLDIQNVYNATNPEATLYNYRFSESGPLQGLPFLPTLGVRGSF